MYYSQPCSYCNKVFYIYENDPYKAAEKLYEGIKKHLLDYNEDDREYKYDDGLEKDSEEIMHEMNMSKNAPSGGYEIK